MARTQDVGLQVGLGADEPAARFGRAPDDIGGKLTEFQITGLLYTMTFVQTYIKNAGDVKKAATKAQRAFNKGGKLFAGDKGDTIQVGP